VGEDNFNDQPLRLTPLAAPHVVNQKHVNIVKMYYCIEIEIYAIATIEMLPVIQ
jgi:hypothetical protein